MLEKNGVGVGQHVVNSLGKLVDLGDVATVLVGCHHEIIDFA
jgi:hypothetical protein